MANIVHSDNVQARIAEIIKLHPAALFMKGSPSNPQRGFSAATAAGAVGADRMSRECSVEDGAMSPLIADARCLECVKGEYRHD
jgi:hypothetical protein